MRHVMAQKSDEVRNAFAAISEYLTIKNKENSQLKCISLKLRVLIYIEGVFELLTPPRFDY